MKTYWYTGNIDRIAEMLREKLSASQIAAHFPGTSRNAVIGFVSRNDTLREIGLARRASPTNIEKARPKARRARPRLSVVKSAPEPRKTLAGEPHTAGIPLGLFNGNRCKWCINEPEQWAASHLFCGEATDGKNYCEHHASRAFGNGTPSEAKAVAWAMKQAA